MHNCISVKKMLLVTQGLLYVLLIATGNEASISNNQNKYFLYTKTNRKQELLNDDFRAINTEAPMKFLIHGWGETADRRPYEEMKDAYLIKGEYNVILVDWSLDAARPYFQAVTNTRQVGSSLGDFITSVHASLNVPLKNIHIIGHSLGAHVAGFTGKRVQELTGGKVARISGLDPAGPSFDGNHKTERLSEYDAEVVDVTHTDIKYFGYTQPLGTVDFYANGGHRPQPGCELLNPEILKLEPTQIAFCSHIKSYEYFTEAINNNGIIATECNSYMNYRNEVCNLNKTVIYGDNLKPLDVKGVYYFKTNAVKPYFTLTNN